MRLSNGLVYQNGRFLENGGVCISDGLFSCESTDGVQLDCTGCRILPGLVDIHTHGAAGSDTMDATREALETISREKLRYGTTTFLPTVMTDSACRMRQAAQAVFRAMEDGLPGADAAGVYMEGPYFSPLRAGAQNREFLRMPSLKEFADILNTGKVRVVSLAPELPGAGAFLEAYRGTVRLAAGHTDADYAQMQEAEARGVTIMTHTFNGMRGFTHRQPNAVGRALDSDVFCELICDGLHLAPAAVRLLFKAKAAQRLVMISDSIRPAGLGDGESLSGGQRVFLRGGVARLADGTIAGSTACLLDGIRNAVRFGIPLEKAVQAATENPARAAGIGHLCGSIRPGRKGDVLVLDEGLEIRYIIKSGRLVSH